MKTTLKHKDVSYPENPIILLILVQTTTLKHKVVSYPVNPIIPGNAKKAFIPLISNPGSDNNIETQRSLLS